MEKDDSTWLNVGYVAFLAIASYVAYKALETLGLQFGWQERYEWFESVATVGSIVIGALSTWYLRRDKERHEYFLAGIAELRKVSWPTWADTKRMTAIVCVVVAVFAVIMTFFDLLWARALHLLLA